MSKKFLDKKYNNFAVYETKKHFVKNEVKFVNGRNKVFHTYRKKTKLLENKLNKRFGRPILTKKGRVWL